MQQESKPVRLLPQNQGRAVVTDGMGCEGAKDEGAGTESSDRGQVQTAVQLSGPANQSEGP